MIFKYNEGSVVALHGIFGFFAFLDSGSLIVAFLAKTLIETRLLFFSLQMFFSIWSSFFPNTTLSKDWYPEDLVACRRIFLLLGDSNWGIWEWRIVMSAIYFQSSSAKSKLDRRQSKMDRYMIARRYTQNKMAKFNIYWIYVIV